jgi:hypothetical protein
LITNFFTRQEADKVKQQILAEKERIMLMQMVLCTSPDSATLDQANASVKQASNSIKKLEAQLLFLQDVYQKKEDKILKIVPEPDHASFCS